jgi:hypothetical protein
MILDLSLPFGIKSKIMTDGPAPLIDAGAACAPPPQPDTHTVLDASLRCFPRMHGADGHS